MKKYALLFIIFWSAIPVVKKLIDAGHKNLENLFPLSVFALPVLILFITIFIESHYVQEQVGKFAKVNYGVLKLYLVGVVTIPIIIGMQIMNFTIYIGVAANVLLFIANIKIFNFKSD